MDIRLLSKDDIKSFHKAFSTAFANNTVLFNPTMEEFEYRIFQKLRMDFDISAATFDGEDILGFISHTSNIYEGIPTAFNGGTGVIPGFRNQKIAEQLYEYLIPKIRSKFIARVLLEVVESNKTAIRLYEKIGFTYRRSFQCYKMVKTLGSNVENVTEEDLNNLDNDFADFEPSFIDSIQQLKRGSEKVLVYKKEGETVGYIIFQPHIGRISQLAVSRLHRGENIGKVLLNAAQKNSIKPVTIMNVPDDEFGFDTFLKKSGFENQVNQFEMELIV
ncbi:MAG: GNAT family N-acetyltransferase [Ekhidna sp.]